MSEFASLRAFVFAVATWHQPPSCQLAEGPLKLSSYSWTYVPPMRCLTAACIRSAVDLKTDRDPEHSAQHA